MKIQFSYQILKTELTGCSRYRINCIGNPNLNPNLNPIMNYIYMGMGKRLTLYEGSQKLHNGNKLSWINLGLDLYLIILKLNPVEPKEWEKELKYKYEIQI